ncbi:hypothetical protein ABE494_10655 [Stenotrophomonas lactitubi]|uniref:hypothetical protein n=1 Tax=Stenotrophomonas TaxID=40323 RepID=UPI000D388797|nr:hypothetical protein [Stenotrophomonas sp. HMWF023]PTS75260.1 hypothetical protein DBR20_11995 [Stenotrophomonas sp. HMWF023]PTT36903.1 hypothetical protein DBR33_18810 [Stenotrophomonas sp. HMWF022]
MRCSRLLLPALGLALLTACQGRSPEPGSAPAKDDAASVDKATGDGKLRWSEAVVWDGDLNACRQGDSAATRDCLRDAMRSGGASADAVTAAEQLSTGGELAYVTAWHEHDGLGVATVEYPFRANTNEGTRLVDAAGRRIDVDAVQLDDTLRADPGVQEVLKAHPQATPFAPAQAAGTAALDGGGIRLLYRTPLRDCHACPDVGQLQIGYDFDGKRNFIGQQVVPVTP